MQPILSSMLIEELKAQVRLCLPVSLQMLMKRSVDVVTLMAVGHLSPHSMSAASIATVTANVFGNSFIMGLVCAIDFIVVILVEIVCRSAHSRLYAVKPTVQGIYSLFN